VGSLNSYQGNYERRHQWFSRKLLSVRVYEEGRGLGEARRCPSPQLSSALLSSPQQHARRACGQAPLGRTSGAPRARLIGVRQAMWLPTALRPFCGTHS